MKRVLIFIVFIQLIPCQIFSQNDGDKKWYKINSKQGSKSNSLNNKKIDKCFSEEILGMLESRLFLCYKNDHQNMSIRKQVRIKSNILLGVNINSFIYVPEDLESKGKDDSTNRQKSKKISLSCEKFDSISGVSKVDFTFKDEQYLISSKYPENSSVQFDENPIIKDKDYIIATISDSLEYEIKYESINLSKIDLNSKIENLKNGLIFELVNENGMITFKLVGYLSKQKSMIFMNKSSGNLKKNKDKSKK